MGATFSKLFRWPLRYPITFLSVGLLLIAIFMSYRSRTRDDAIRYRTRSDLVMACDSKGHRVVLEYFQYAPLPGDDRQHGFWCYSMPLRNFDLDDDFVFRHERWGFTYASERLVSQWDTTKLVRYIDIASGREFAFPYWALFILFSLLPGWRVAAIFRRKNREQNRLCANCSYDLRAHSPGGRCPECGSLISETTRWC